MTGPKANRQNRIQGHQRGCALAICVRRAIATSALRLRVHHEPSRFSGSQQTKIGGEGMTFVSRLGQAKNGARNIINARVCVHSMPVQGVMWR